MCRVTGVSHVTIATPDCNYLDLGNMCARTAQFRTRCLALREVTSAPNALLPF